MNKGPIYIPDYVFVDNKPFSRGGMGDLYNALHAPTMEMNKKRGNGFAKASVVVKIPRTDLNLSANIEEFVRNSFKNEIYINSGFRDDPNFPGIVQNFNEGDRGATPYIIMNDINGRDLSKILEDLRNTEKPLPFSYLIYFARNVYGAIGRMNKNGFVNCDVKPENIIIPRNEENIPKVIDFGLAQKKGGKLPAELKGKGIGSDYHSAPELQKGSLDPIDQAADIYSLGILLAEGISNEYPIIYHALKLDCDQRDPSDLPYEIINKKLLKIKETGRAGNWNLTDLQGFRSEEIPSGLMEIVERSLKANPADRITIEEAVSILDEFSLKEKDIKAAKEWIRREYSTFRVAPSRRVLRKDAERNKFFKSDHSSSESLSLAA